MNFSDFKNIKKTFRKHKENFSIKYAKKTEIKKPEKPKDIIPFFITFSISFLGTVFMLLPVVLLAGGIGYFEIKYHDKFYPGVSVGGEKVGGLTYDEAYKYFQKKSEEFKEKGIPVEFENLQGQKEKIVIPVSASGLSADTSVEYMLIDGWENDLTKAYKYGRSLNIFKSVWQQSGLIFSRKNFYFSNVLQKDSVEFLVDSGLYNFLKKSKSAEFYVNKNKLFVSKEIIGEIAAREEILKNLEQKLLQFDSSVYFYKSFTDPNVVTKDQLENFVSFADNLKEKRNLVFTYKKHIWNINGNKFVTWLTLNEKGELIVNKEKVLSYFNDYINKYIENPPVNSRFGLENGELVEIVAGKTGNVIDTEKVIAQMNNLISDFKLNQSQNLQKETVYIPIEILEIKPKVTKETISEYHIKDLVGKVQTTFYGSTAARIHNIKIGVNTINGTLIAPGEEFSTIKAIGPVTGKEGYLKETVIKQNKTAKEFGGGLCQVATTLFRLAINTGLPITERINHKFVVHYYDPPGLDAAIYGPHPDLRFVNDTGSYLLLQARVEDQKVIMELYGKRDGRKVDISKATSYNWIPAPAPKYISTVEIPKGQVKCTESPHDGLTTSVLYKVIYPNGIEKERIFKSIYQPWQKVCLVGV